MRNNLLRIVLIVLVQVSLWLGSSSLAQALTEDQKLFNDAWRIVNQAYVDESFNHQNWWAIREKKLKPPFHDRGEAYEAIRTILGSLDDPFTRFLQPAQYRSLRSSTAGELSGVGLQVITNAESGQLEVLTPILGSPAARAGLRPHDKILEIDGVDATQLSLDEAAEKMRGTIGTEVVLKVEQRQGNEGVIVSNLSIRRDRIELHPVTSDLRKLASGQKIAYLQLNQFNANAAQEMRNSIQAMEQKKVDGYVLDLRNNPGGLLQAGVEIARFWLDPGIIVYSIDRHGILNSFSAIQEAMTHKPLVVLVNNGSASASEILAGALQDNLRAKLVGEQTFGKGSIQSLFDLSDGSGMAVTIAKYETPNHKNINKVGIKPDIEVSAENLFPENFGQADDAQYQGAVDVLLAEIG
jgi:carboxyl-terminal processing protease